VSNRQLAMLIALAAIWGSSFMFIKVAVDELAPSTLVAGRLVLAAATLAVIVGAGSQLRAAFGAIRRHLGVFVFVALLNTVVPFWFLAWGETRIDSGLAALLQACAPLFTAVLAALFVHAERVTGLRLVGVVVGFMGVALLVGGVPSGSVLGALAVVLSAFCYAVSALTGARRLGHVAPTMIAFGTTVVATVISLPFGLAELPASTPSWEAIVSVVMLGVLGLGIAYLLYFALITGAGASRALLVTYLVPPMALFYGAVVLGESVSLTDLAGLALILTGVALGTGTAKGLRRRAAARVPAS
jgi:drug/metabolite transporter (DMT)-like permease